MMNTGERRTFLVTGGHGGLGLQCARTLARDYNADLLLVGRDPTRMAAAADGIRSEFGADVTLIQADLGNLADVRAAAAEIRKLAEAGALAPLHGIVCNAGLMTPPDLVLSKEGIEQTFAVNHLAHFLMVDLLLPILSAPGRIVVVSSDTHDPKHLGGRMAKPVVPDAMQLAFPDKDGAPPLKPMQRYATTKVCNVLFAYELDRRIRRSDRGIAVLAFNPGFTPGTGFTRNLPRIGRFITGSRPFIWLMGVLGAAMGDQHFSGEAMGRVAGDAQYQEKSGTYLECHDFGLHERRSSAVTYDPVLAGKLWAESEQLTKAA